MSRVALLIVMVLTFAPAAVLGALPLVLPAVVAVTASLAALHLAVPESSADLTRAEPAAEPGGDDSAAHAAG